MKEQSMTWKTHETLTDKELHESNLVKAINLRVISIASYGIRKLLDELDKMIKQQLGEKNMHGVQASDERLHESREHGGRRWESVKEVYENTHIWVECY